MIHYDMGVGVEAFSTNIGDDISSLRIVTPMHQAHSTRVAEIRTGEEDTYGMDALITNTRNICIGVRTADCVPILLLDSAKHAVAAIHSGWKGTVADIIACTIEKMHHQYGTEATCIKAVIGPCIHLETFEVGDEVHEAFCEKGYGQYCRRMPNPYDPNSAVKWHIDLPAICSHQLQECGVRDIYKSPLCTYLHSDTLYSYRRSKCADPRHRIFTAIKMH